MSPALRPEDRAVLLGPVGRPCHRCHGVRVTHYCRSCDEFFFECGCTDRPRHEDHRRIYRWTPTGILAIPDFDQ